jgi:hypothetical protein
MQASRTYVLWCPMTLSSVWLLGNKYECRHKINVIISAQFRKVTWILTMNFHSENLALDYTFPIHFLFNIRASVKDFMGVVHEGALLPTLHSSFQRYHPNITIIWDGRICMFAVLLRFTLSFVYKFISAFYHVYVGLGDIKKIISRLLSRKLSRYSIISR